MILSYSHLLKRDIHTNLEGRCLFDRRWIFGKTLSEAVYTRGTETKLYRTKTQANLLNNEPLGANGRQITCSHGALCVIQVNSQKSPYRATLSNISKCNLYILTDSTTFVIAVLQGRGTFRSRRAVQKPTTLLNSSQYLSFSSIRKSSARNSQESQYRHQ